MSIFSKNVFGGFGATALNVSATQPVRPMCPPDHGVGYAFGRRTCLPYCDVHRSLLDALTQPCVPRRSLLPGAGGLGGFWDIGVSDVMSAGGLLTAPMNAVASVWDVATGTTKKKQAAAQAQAQANIAAIQAQTAQIEAQTEAMQAAAELQAAAPQVTVATPGAVAPGAAAAPAMSMTTASGGLNWTPIALIGGAGLLALLLFRRRG